MLGYALLKKKKKKKMLGYALLARDLPSGTPK